MKTLKIIAASVFCMSLAFISQNTHAQANGKAPAQGSYKNIFEMLKDVPGLDVKSNNGKSGSIIVRGTSTLTGSTDPLFVIDGSVFTGDIGNLNPQDIASITVLKDAGSTAAYGSRGMNGVIVITSKNGTGATSSKAEVTSHTESAYTYFITHKTPLRVFGLTDNVIVEGVIVRQQDSTLVFIKKRKELLVPINTIKKVEMMPQDN